jgi:hypothetical protein
MVCRDDGEAIEQAKELLDDRTIELWCGARLVTRIRSRNSGSPQCSSFWLYNTG